MRRLTTTPFPPYTHVPGRTPHPVSDPAGHSYGRTTEPPQRFDPAEWRTCHAYLFGIDLFNHGYYWEAHEAWESLWLAAGRTGPVADFLKGLIKLAAAGVKAAEGNRDGARSHAKRAAELFRASAPLGDRVMGLDRSELERVADVSEIKLMPQV